MHEIKFPVEITCEKVGNEDRLIIRDASGSMIDLAILTNVLNGFQHYSLINLP